AAPPRRSGPRGAAAMDERREQGEHRSWERAEREQAPRARTSPSPAPWTPRSPLPTAAERAWARAPGAEAWAPGRGRAPRPLATAPRPLDRSEGAGRTRASKT